MNPLIEKVEAHRKEMGLSKEKMAAMIGVNLNTYALWTLRDKKPSAIAIKCIMNLEFMKGG